MSDQVRLRLAELAPQIAAFSAHCERYTSAAKKTEPMRVALWTEYAAIDSALMYLRLDCYRLLMAHIAKKATR